MKRIKSFGIYQTAKVVSIIYVVVAAVIFVPLGLITMIFGIQSMGFPFGGAAMLFLPIFYGIVGFIMTAIGCAVYNYIAKWTGGIEFEVATEESDSLDSSEVAVAP